MAPQVRFNFNITEKLLIDKVAKHDNYEQYTIIILEDTTLDGKNIDRRNGPKKYKIRRYIKRIHNIDIKQKLTGETTPTGEIWDEKEPEFRQDLIRGAGP